MPSLATFVKLRNSGSELVRLPRICKPDREQRPGECWPLTMALWLETGLVNLINPAFLSLFPECLQQVPLTAIQYSRWLSASSRR